MAPNYSPFTETISQEAQFHFYSSNTSLSFSRSPFTATGLTRSVKKIAIRCDRLTYHHPCDKPTDSNDKSHQLPKHNDQVLHFSKGDSARRGRARGSSCHSVSSRPEGRAELVPDQTKQRSAKNAGTPFPQCHPLAPALLGGHFQPVPNLLVIFPPCSRSRRPANNLDNFWLAWLDGRRKRASSSVQCRTAGWNRNGDQLEVLEAMPAGAFDIVNRSVFLSTLWAVSYELSATARALAESREPTAESRSSFRAPPPASLRA